MGREWERGEEKGRRETIPSPPLEGKKGGLRRKGS